MLKATEFKIARIRAGLRQIDIALKLGISPTLVSHIENELRIPTPEMSKKLNELLNVKVYPEN